MEQLIKKNLEHMNLTRNEILSYEEATAVINNHVIAKFANKPIMLKEVRDYTGLELAEKVALIHATMFDFLKNEILDNQSTNIQH